MHVPKLKSPCPELFAKLAEAIPKMAAGDKDKTFALSLHDGHIKNGGWSDKQAYWAEKMAEKVSGVKTPETTLYHLKPEVADLISQADKMAAHAANYGMGAEKMLMVYDSVTATDLGFPLLPLVKTMKNAEGHLKKPQVTLTLSPFQPYHYPDSIKVIKSKFNNDLWAVLANGGAYNKKYLGTINSKGGWNPKGLFKGQPQMMAEVYKVLENFAKNPTSVSASYGHETGKCCYCNKKLTDPPSVSAGYGPVCAAHYGLPWGSVKPGWAKHHKGAVSGSGYAQGDMGGGLTKPAASFTLTIPPPPLPIHVGMNSASAEAFYELRKPVQYLF